MARKMNVVNIPFSSMTLLPPAPGKCRVCATEHDPALPHNRDSLYYQMAFHQQHDRWPTWDDAMAHCADEVKARWKEAYDQVMRERRAKGEGV